jgi:hypothetical protein
VAQNHTYVRYELRVNEPEFDSIVGNKWYLKQNLPNSANKAVPFNIGSTAAKAAWRILTEIDAPNRSRYYVVRDAQVFDVIERKCTKQDIALVGFHAFISPLRPESGLNGSGRLSNTLIMSREKRRNPSRRRPYRSPSTTAKGRRRSIPR